MTLETTSDHNKIFSKCDKEILFNRLEQVNQSIKLKKIESSKDLLETEEDQHIGLIWIRAHGEREKIYFGPNFTATTPDLQPMLDKMNAKGIVVLDSCYTGERSSHQNTPPIAEAISNYLCSTGKNQTLSIFACLTFQEKTSLNFLHAERG